MENKTAVKLFEQQQIRTHWDDKQEKWYFSIVDVVAILTESPRPRKYWNALKTKLAEEGSELSQKMGQLKMQALDGKMRATKQGGSIAGNTQKEIEEKTGKKIVTKLSAKNYLAHPKKDK